MESSGREETLKIEWRVTGRIVPSEAYSSLW